MNARAWIATFAAFLAGTAALTAASLSVGTEEPASAFGDEQAPAPLVAEAIAQGLDVSRLVSGPPAFAVAHEHDPARTVLVVIAPPRPYDESETDAVHALLEQGGKVLVADNFGHANSLTQDLGFTFERVRLVEVDDDGRIGAAFDGKAMSLQTAAPTALHVDPGVAHRVLAASSNNSFLDRDGNGLVEGGEPNGPFPVLIQADVGAAGGQLLLLSDPSVVASADTLEGNRAFLRSVLAFLLPEGGHVVVDESRTPTPDPSLFAAATLVGIATTDEWRTVFGVLAVVFFVAAAALVVRDGWGPHRFDINRFIRRAELRSAPRSGRADDGRNAGATRLGVRWSRRGRAAVGGAVVLAVFGTVLGNEQATYAAAFVLLAAALAMWTGPASVRARRTVASDRVPEGSTPDVEITLESARGHAAQVDVLDSLAPEFELADGHNWFRTTLRRKTPVSHRYRVRAGLRGPHAIGPLRLRTSDAFGLRVVETMLRPGHEVLVLPRSEPLSKIPFQSKVPQMTLGPHLVNRAGDGTEFHSLRDYQTGDSFRIVNWKASARSSDLVVNQRVHESMATVTIFLDARAVTAAGTVSRNPLNEGCRAVQSIVSGALRARDKVRVFVYGDGVQELGARVSSAKAHVVSQELARLTAKGATTLREAVELTLPKIKPHFPVVVVSALEDDPTVVEGLSMLRQRDALPFVLAMQIDTQPPDEGGEPEPEARELHAARERMLAEIRAVEVPMLPRIPGVPLGTLFQVGLQ